MDWFLCVVAAEVVLLAAIVGAVGVEVGFAPLAGAGG